MVWMRGLQGRLWDLPREELYKGCRARGGGTILQAIGRGAPCDIDELQISILWTIGKAGRLWRL
jgi:hypothetical protein